MEAGSSFGDDEAGPEGIATIQGIIMLIATASIFGMRRTEDRDLQAGQTSTHVVVYLSVDLFVSFKQA